MSVSGSPIAKKDAHATGCRQPTATSIPTSRRKSSTIPRRTRRQYAEAINAYSKLSASNSLYAGLHFENLAGYLLEPFEARGPAGLVSSPPEDGKGVSESPTFNFATLYDLGPSSKDPINHFNSISEFENTASSLLAATSHGQLLFMRGHPSAEWLTAIGAKYSVEPDFLQRHLDFRPQRPNYFSLPSLPSSSQCIVRLRIPTIGIARPESTFRPTGTSSYTEQEALEALRAQSSSSLQAYFEKLRSHTGPSLGDSIVRDYSVHDMGHFSIEQDISIYVKRAKKSWIAFIWLDNGKDLGEGLTSWLATMPSREHSWNSKMKYLPVVQHKTGIALQRRSLRFVAPLDKVETSEAVKIIQSASLLHLDYGHDTDQDILGIDSFYALHEVFSFAAFAYAQFFNMLVSQLASELDQSVLIEQKNPTLSNLLYNQQILERHILRIQEIILCLESSHSTDWPSGRMDEEKKIKVDAATKSILQDYQYLLQQGQSLCERCNRGMQIIMNNAMIKESRKAISQTSEVTKLTRLAFVFIPLSFTASLFGMNVTPFQLEPGYLSIWVWFVVSFPLFTISLLSMKYNVPEVLGQQAQKLWVTGKFRTRQLLGGEKSIVSEKEVTAQKFWDV